jgi:type IV pilus assembly protein PilE
LLNKSDRKSVDILSGVRAASSTGFSLIEVMIVMVIIGVLLMVAVPGYQESMKKTRRTDAMRDLMELTSRQERFYAQHSEYAQEVESPTGLNFGNAASSAEHYTLSVTACEDKDPDDFSACYVLIAEPKPGGLQSDDKCGTLSVDSRGQRKASNLTQDSCW